LSSADSFLISFIFILSFNPHYNKFNTLFYMILFRNTPIIDRKGSIQAREGCLSVPDFTGNVIRSKSIKIRFFDEQFNRREIEACGFESIVFQHEIDHLDGLLFLDRVRSLKKDVFRRKMYQNPKHKKE
ncbi:peptide deformylase, partial [bacterium]|nr:peptide deformylase [bacterium]